MHTCTCSHLLFLTYVSRNTNAHISASCGWHPWCCETSCIPHAYITPFPPPLADHSSFYPAFALSLSLSFSHWNQSGWRPLLTSKISVTQGIKGCIPADVGIRLKSENLTHKSAQPVTTQRVTEISTVKLPLLPVHVCTHSHTHTPMRTHSVSRMQILVPST